MKIFEVEDIFGNIIVLTNERWNHTIRHKVPGIESLKRSLRKPYEVRKSRYDEYVFLYYRRFSGNFLSTVVQSKDGFLMTAYTTDKIK
ncbi:MAG: hypothetical protein ABEJ56_00380 [Candidatus Nanohaloarchaea archaeon]